MGNFCQTIDTDQKGLINGGDLFLVTGKDLQSSYHNLIGAIVFKNSKQQQCIGSCILLSRDAFLTVAHNFYDKIEKKQNNDFKIYFGDSTTGQNYLEIQSWRYSQLFKLSSLDTKLEYDYAIGKLKKPISYENFLQIQQPCPNCLVNDKNSRIQIFGYPIYKENLMISDKYGEKKIIKQYGIAKKDSILNVEKYKITYKVSTFPGQSGCSIIISNKIIAIHSGAGRQGQNFNIGRLVTKDMIQSLKKWGKELNIEGFKVAKVQCQHFKKRNQNSMTIQKAEKLFINAKSSYNSKQYKLATQQFQQCLQIQETLKEKGHLSTAPTLTHIGASLQKQKNYPQALKRYFLSRNIYEKHNKAKQLDNCENLNNIGWVYYNQQKYAESIKKYKECIQILEKKQKGQFYAAVLCNLGIAYYKQQNYREAVKVHKQSLLIYEQLNQSQWVKNNALHITKCLKALNQTQKMQSVINLYSLDISQI